MPFIANKTLQGVQRLDVSGGTYIFELPANPFPFAPGTGTNALELRAIEEVWIICEGEGVFIQLPNIANFQGGWNPKIYVLNASPVPAVVSSNDGSETLPGNDINGGASIEVPENKTAYIRVVSDLNWGAWY